MTCLYCGAMEIETPKECWRGNWARPELFALLEQNKISHTEFCLLLVIDNFTEYGDSRGCFASSKHLAKKISVSAGRIDHMIGHLKKLKLLTKVAGGKRSRFLRCVWDNVSIVAKSVNRESVKNDRLESVKNDSHNIQGVIRGNLKVPPERRKANARVNIVSKTNNKHTNGHDMLTNDFQVKLPVSCVEPRITDQDVLRAKLLWEVLFKLKRLRSDKRNCSFAAVKKSWSKVLAKLARDKESALVGVVVGWYVKHAADQYTPVVWSVTSFVSKFKQIEAAMERHNKANPTVKSTKSGKRVTERLMNFHWPKESADKLAVAVELSLLNYKKFLKSLDDDQLKNGKRKLARWIKERLHTPEEFVHVWFAETFEDKEGWDKWNGDLIREVFTYDCPRFRKFCVGQTIEYCGDGKQWLAILGKLKP